MTTHELARKLLEMPDVMATIPGKEGGVNEVKYVDTPGKMVPNYYDADEWWMGRHRFDEQDGTVDAVFIS